MMLNFVMNFMCITDGHKDKYDYCTTQFVNNFIFIFWNLFIFWKAKTITYM